VVERFATGTRADRIALLTDLRATEPDFARTLIEDTWADEQAATRAGLLDCLHIGLSNGDEPLLEQALDDRAATVRATAAALLDRLPESARGQRMAARAVRLTSPTRRHAATASPTTASPGTVGPRPGSSRFSPPPRCPPGTRS
jgi:hypothetical protein